MGRSRGPGWVHDLAGADTGADKGGNREWKPGLGRVDILHDPTEEVMAKFVDIDRDPSSFPQVVNKQERGNQAKTTTSKSRTRP
jgi:hypothetical protein